MLLLVACYSLVGRLLVACWLIVSCLLAELLHLLIIAILTNGYDCVLACYLLVNFSSPLQSLKASP